MEFVFNYRPPPPTPPVSFFAIEAAHINAIVGSTKGAITAVRSGSDAMDTAVVMLRLCLPTDGSTTVLETCAGAHEGQWSRALEGSHHVVVIGRTAPVRLLEQLCAAGKYVWVVGSGPVVCLPGIFRIVISKESEDAYRLGTATFPAATTLLAYAGGDVDLLETMHVASHGVRYVNVSDYAATMSHGMCLTAVSVFVAARGRDVTAEKRKNKRTADDDDYNMKDVSWASLRNAYEYVVTAAAGGVVSDVYGASPPPGHLESLERAGWVRGTAKGRRRYRSYIPPELVVVCADALQADPAMFL